MADSIRKQILDAFAVRAALIRTANGYETEIGQNVLEAVKQEDPDDVPFVNVWPQPEESSRVEGRHVNIMVVRLEALIAHGGDPVAQSEAALADMIEAFVGIRWTVPFDSGGTYEVEIGNTVTGATSGATGYVTGVNKSNGTWAGGDAEGTLELARVSPGPDGFQDGENLDVGANSNVATIDGTVVYDTPEAIVTNSLASDIKYRTGGVDGYPNPGEVNVGVFADFEVEYATYMGNPYIS